MGVGGVGGEVLKLVWEEFICVLTPHQKWLRSAYHLRETLKTTFLCAPFWHILSEKKVQFFSLKNVYF